ncbi:MAG: EAL domain-containing protein [Thermomicrobiales bacterium]
MLKIEISESITLDELEAALPLINGLARLRYRTGARTISAGNLAGRCCVDRTSMRSSPDRSFTAGDAGECPENIEMAAALAGFAAQLGMGISIEGVEREDQAATVRDAGVFRAQGLHFGMPNRPR